MSEVEFRLNDLVITIQCNENDIMKDIINKFIIKTQSDLDINSLSFIYGGEKINVETTFSENLKFNDKDSKKMVILVYLNIEKKDDSNLYINSREIICPTCGEGACIDIKDYKISFYGCKNDHKIDNTLLDEYEKSQIIDQSKIICQICKLNNKKETYNNEFYKCCSCKINICPICIIKHDNSHNIIKFDVINYLCDLHHCKYNSYCKSCKKNICVECEQIHQNHNILYYGKLLPKIDSLKLKLDELRKYIDEFKININSIVNILNEEVESLEKFYKINSGIILNYDVKNLNYELLKNINSVNNFNINIIKDLSKVNEDNNMFNKCKNIINIYKKIKDKDYIEIKVNDNNEEKENKKIIYDIEDFNKKVPIFGKQFVENNKEKCYIIYNNRKYRLQSYFKFEKNGLNELELQEVEQLKNLSYMFTYVYSIKNFNFLSELDLSNVENISYMFAATNINDLKSISGWNTRNIKDMRGLFCLEYEKIPNSTTDLNPLKNWDVSNVEDMSFMFGGRKIISLKSLEKWELFKAKSLEGMFRKCEFLNGLEGIENWNLFSCKNIKDMFYQCKGIKSLVSLKYWDTSKIENMSRLFYENNIESLKGLENWNLSNCINFNEIFKDCKLIEDLSPIQNWLNFSIYQNNEHFSSTFNPMPLLNQNNQNKNCNLFTNQNNQNNNCNLFTNQNNRNNNCNLFTNQNNQNNNCGNVAQNEILKSMESMFENCSSIKSVIPLENWEIIKFNNFKYLFKNCKSIEDFSPLSKWKFRSSKETTDIFSGTSQKGVNQVNINKPKKVYGNLFG